MYPCACFTNAQTNANVPKTARKTTHDEERRDGRPRVQAVAGEPREHGSVGRQPEGHSRVGRLDRHDARLPVRLQTEHVLVLIV